MYEIEIDTRFDADAPQVFEVLSDHATFLSTGPATCRVTTNGDPAPNGRGAVREVEVGNLHFHEEITDFRPPQRYEYRIRQVLGPSGIPLPVRHERGWLELTPDDGGTRVVWRSRFEVTVPLLASFLEKRIGPRFEAAFRGFLDQAKRRLEAA